MKPKSIAATVCACVTLVAIVADFKSRADGVSLSLRQRNHTQSPLNSSMEGQISLSFALELGHWQFPDSPWSIEMVRVPTKQLDMSLALGESNSVTGSKQEHNALLDLVPDLGFNTVRTPSAYYRWFTSDGTRLRVYFVAKSEPVQVLGAVVAVREADGDWQVTKLRPSMNSASSNDHLMPLMTGCSSVAIRMSEEANLQAELVQIPAGSSLLEHQQLWLQSGWRSISLGLWEKDQELVHVNAIPKTETNGGCIQFTSSRTQKGKL